MKATKAYIASLGTTGVLLAAALLMLAVVSAVVAFDRWPGGNVSTPVKTLVLSERPAAIRVSGNSTAPSATPGSATAGAGGPNAAQPRAVGRAPSVLGENIRGGTPVVAAPAPVATPQVPKTVDDVQNSAAPLFDAVSNPGTTAGQIAGGVQTATDAAGTNLQQISPDLGQTVTELGQSAANTVRDVPLPDHIIPGH